MFLIVMISYIVGVEPDMNQNTPRLLKLNGFLSRNALHVAVYDKNRNSIMHPLFKDNHYVKTQNVHYKLASPISG